MTSLITEITTLLMSSRHGPTGSIIVGVHVGFASKPSQSFQVIDRAPSISQSFSVAEDQRRGEGIDSVKPE